jgi:hypothetical protein
MMKISLPALAGVAVAAWFLLPKRTQRGGQPIESPREPADWDGAARNAEERLQRTYAPGFTEGIGRSIRQSDHEQLSALDARPAAESEPDRLVPGLPDDLRGR